MPRTFVQSRGRALKRDIIYGGGFYLSLISEKLKTELEEAEVTGVEFIPIEIELKNGSKYSDYYAMIIHGRAKAADRNDSHPEWIEEEPQSMWRDVGYMFPLDSWDGSDIFCSEEGKAVVVSEKAQRIFAKYPECCELVRCDRHIYPLASKRCSKTEARNKNIIPNGDIQRNV
ncbi:MAG: hypothetical protein IJ779_01330 [Ruminococcus sp.]|nr:hypothetical protein [Ruminococcus sp.]